jgi:predicted nucleic acid-binding protein
VSYLLDTCVVSELMRPAPAASVSAWLDAYAHRPVYLSVLTVGELAQGIAKLRESSRRTALTDWLHNTVLPNYQGRVLGVDGAVALRWGALRGDFMRLGRTPPVIDSMLAATALSHGLTLATRNTRDFEAFGVAVINPWETNV